MINRLNQAKPKPFVAMGWTIVKNFRNNIIVLIHNVPILEILKEEA